MIFLFAYQQQRYIAVHLYSGFIRFTRVLLHRIFHKNLMAISGINYLQGEKNK